MSKIVKKEIIANVSRKSFMHLWERTWKTHLSAALGSCSPSMDSQRSKARPESAVHPFFKSRKLRAKSLGEWLSEEQISLAKGELKEEAEKESE